MWEPAAFDITGPETLTVGTTGIWRITASMFELYNQVMVDVMAPLSETITSPVLNVDLISIEVIGMFSSSFL